MDKIKVSDIRAQFPMYADISDDQLLMAVRQKFYSDIPPSRFYSRIEYDAPDATEGMSELDKFRAGIGKGMADFARGVGQSVGIVSRDDVANARRLDKSLMGSGAGTAGNVVGSVASMLPTAMLPGAATIPGAAAIGAAAGFLAPSTGTEETLKNTGIGGVLGPASIVAGRAIGAGAQAAKALVDPFTKSGQDRIAARTLQQFASDPMAAAANLRNARPLVPGSMPTMAQASDDAGLAQLERTLRNNPETGPILQSQLDAQRSARLKAVQDIGGTEQYYQGIRQGRDIFAKQDYDAAIAAGFDAKAVAAASDDLAKLMKRPSIQSAQRLARDLAAESGDELTDIGSIKGLDYLVKALDSKISAARNVGSPVGKEEFRALLGTKDDLLAVVEKIAPAYKEARENFAKMSRQINAMDVARDVLGKMQSPLGRYGATQREMKNEYARALESAMESTKRATGLDLPASAFMPKRDLDMLENVARDMGRASKADDAGRAVGSNTAQNLASQNLLRRALGPTGLPQSWAESNALQAFLSPYTGVAKLAGSERAVLERLTKAATDPADAASLLLMTGRPSVAGLLGNQAMRYVPAAPLGLLGESP